MGKVSYHGSHKMKLNFISSVTGFWSGHYFDNLDFKSRARDGRQDPLTMQEKVFSYFLKDTLHIFFIEASVEVFTDGHHSFLTELTHEWPA